MRNVYARQPPSFLGDEELELEEICEALQTFSEVLDGICPAILLETRLISFVLIDFLK